MPRRSRGVLAVLLLASTLAALAVRPAPARASLPDAVCGVIGTIGEGWMGKACKVLAHPKRVIAGGKALLSGKPGKVIGVLLNGPARNALSLSGAPGIAAIVAWAVGGAHFVLTEIAKFVSDSTSPELTAGWFASVYWRVAGVAVLLTLPFLCAAAIQAILRSDGALLARAVFGYLPLSFLATGIAAPVAMMLLAVTDWMGQSVASATGDQGGHFLAVSGAAIGALGVVSGSPFVTFLIALLTAAGGLILWLELLIREAAVYVVVLMLPLVFAAMVWPARRVWAFRAIEVLVALILAKFAIVSVLALAGAALGHGGGSLIVRSLAGLVLVTLGVFAPWVLLRVLPLAEVASATVGHVRDHAQARLTGDAGLATQGLMAATAGTAGLIGRMRGLADDAVGVASDPGDRPGQSAATARLTRVTAAPDYSELIREDPVIDGTEARSASTPPTSGPAIPVAEDPGRPDAPPPVESRQGSGADASQEPEATGPVSLSSGPELDEHAGPDIPRPDPGPESAQ